jgi:hypothetical protein
MILNTGQRTDIPAFYSRWFYRRIKAGTVSVRNPYYEQQVTRYRISPDVIDAICFCTKNPAPMLPGLRALSAFRQYWQVTITPYGPDIEPFVPPVPEVIASFRHLAGIITPECTAWRYDPIFITEKYTIEFHLEAFRKMCESLRGFTHQAIISFLDLYEKTKINFPEGRTVSEADQMRIGAAFARIAEENQMRLYTCHEGQSLARFSVDCSGCMTKAVLERALGEELRVPASISHPRAGCACLLGCDIGAYNSCGHGCRYCYANTSTDLVRHRMKQHDPESPFLIGTSRPDDIVHDADQRKWGSGQMMLPL